MSIALDRLNHISDMLVSAGYTRRTFKNFNDPYHAVFFKPERTNEYYYGTFLNPFSCLEYDEEPGKVYLWTDEVCAEEPAIGLHVVYKRNGAAEDVSVDLTVCHRHFETPTRLALNQHDTSNAIFMRELAKSPTRLDYRIIIRSKSDQVFKKRIYKTASDKQIANAISKASAEFDRFVPVAHDDYADRKDYCPDTTDEHFVWVNDWKARNGRNS